ncbi:MAG TPA: peptidoglycan bridge formation glycyltransferase FemA/FemB family protein [Anaerolineaceae bacterium]
MERLTAQQWDAYLMRHPNAHLLQTSAWGDLKAGYGWQVERIHSDECGGQVLFRQLPLGFSLAYLPKGPVGQPSTAFWQSVDELCRMKRAVMIKIEPDALDGEVTADSLGLTGEWRFADPVQPRRTVVIPLDGGEDKVLSRMKQKTRYNIRLAEKKEISVQPSSNIDLFHKMMLITGRRDGFGVHHLHYYQKAYDLFIAQEACVCLVAYYQQKPLAALMAFARGDRAWYFYGASTDEERNRMPAYLLQWEAIRWAIQRGCKVYDLWGVPDYDEGTLEQQFNNRSDDLWGVYRFKRGFGGVLMRSAGAWEKSYLPGACWIYRKYSSWKKSSMQ